MQLEEKLKLIPEQPGVYLYRNEAGEIIYVGKAVSLKNRVRSYFQAGAQHLPKTKVMLRKVADLDYIVTDTEVEALILEQNLIKEHRPHYNVLLKDDKSYPYLKITLNEAYPRVQITRRHLRDGSRYFGPYTRVGAVNETLRLLKKIFPLRSCNQKEPPRRERPCLNHHIKRCLGPCCGLTDQETYRAMVQEVCLFLEGRQDILSKQLQIKMEEAAAKLQFELAARLRDQLQSIREISEKQKIISGRLEDQDLLAMARAFDEACVMVFFVRGGKLIGRDHFILKGVEDLESAEILASFVKQYYTDADFIPHRVLLSETIVEEKELIEEWLTGKKGAKVTLKTPQRGEKKKLLEMAGQNARITLEQIQNERNARYEEAMSTLTQLAEALGLERPPYRLECYDISNTQGTNSVASMVVFEEGRPARDQYRRFKIRTVVGPDDYSSMQEVLKRRFSRGLKEKALLSTGQISSKEAKFHRLPDLVIVDGGKGQLSAARQSMRELGVANIPTYGLAKEEEVLFGEGIPHPIYLPRNSRALYLLQRLRDEAHRFAITYHRHLRGQAGLKSLLDEIEGVGAKRRQALFQAFGTISAIKKASLGDLAAVKGMNKKTAQAVYNFFHQ